MSPLPCPLPEFLNKLTLTEVAAWVSLFKRHTQRKTETSWIIWLRGSEGLDNTQMRGKARTEEAVWLRLMMGHRERALSVQLEREKVFTEIMAIPHKVVTVVCNAEC